MTALDTDIFEIADTDLDQVVGGEGSDMDPNG